jgi:hypothetical protein
MLPVIFDGGNSINRCHHWVVTHVTHVTSVTPVNMVRATQNVFPNASGNNFNPITIIATLFHSLRSGVRVAANPQLFFMK